MSTSRDDAPSAALDRDTAAILAELRAAAAPDPTTVPIAQARAAFTDTQRLIGGEAVPEVARVEELSAPRPEAPLPVRRYRPSDTAALPAILYFHGGGWTFGDLDSHDGTMRRLALETGATVLGVDYRLAPEHPFPEPLDDAVAAVRWARERAPSLGLDADRIVLAGDSAGANLALASLLVLRDAGDPAPRGAALFYGCYWSNLETDSHARFGGGDHLLTTDRMRWFWDNYLGARGAGDPLAEPMHAELGGLPPLYLTAGGCDPVFDDTVELVRRLEAAGADHEWRVHPGLIHNFLQMAARSDAAARATTEAAAAIRGMLNAA